MPFKPGHKKIGGRAKGTPNRKTFDAVALCERMNFDPLEAMIELGKSTRDENIRVACYKEVAKYTYVQKRATEVSGPNGEPIKSEIQSSELQELLADFKSILHTKISERKEQKAT